MPYQIIVVNIKYGDEFRTYKGSRPQSMVLDVPKDILGTMWDKAKFYDCVEAFAYNTITRSFGAYVSSCQVYLPLED